MAAISESTRVYLIVFIALSALSTQRVQCNPDAKRLYDDLMSSYNSLIRPVDNFSEVLTIKMSLKLSQLIDVVSLFISLQAFVLSNVFKFQNLKNQIMATNMWVQQEWTDNKLRWDPDEYGGVTNLYVPAEQIWLPDIVLYNNADGNYEITIMTKAVIHYDGRVFWNPPAIYKSACEMDITYFPFDTQTCTMKFGSWTYDGYQVDLRHHQERNGTGLVEVGMDLSEFYLSVEWDIMSVPALRKVVTYSCCDTPYLDITFNLTMRRKTLFYTVNLIIPCVGISSLSLLVFYLPSVSGEKVAISVSIFLSLTFYFLVLIEIIPSTSTSLPLVGVYLTFCLVMIALSVLVTIAVLNVHFRSPSTHKMSPWVRRVFIKTLPKILLMRPPQYRIDITDSSDSDNENKSKSDQLDPDQMSPASNSPVQNALDQVTSGDDADPEDDDGNNLYPEFNGNQGNNLPREVEKAIRDAMFIAQHIDNKDEFESIREEWKYVAMVLDRLFLWIFTFTSIAGTLAIFLQAPNLYDTQKPIDIFYSKVARAQMDLGFGDESELLL